MTTPIIEPEEWLCVCGKTHKQSEAEFRGAELSEHHRETIEPELDKILNYLVKQNGQSLMSYRLKHPSIGEAKQAIETLIEQRVKEAYNKGIEDYAIAYKETLERMNEEEKR